MTFLLLWWYSHQPRYAVVEDEKQAVAFAQERNATVVPVHVEAGSYAVRFGPIVDYYFRDAKGEPQPAVERDLGKYPYRLD